MNAKELIEAVTPSGVLIVAAKDLESRARDGGSQPTTTSDLWLARHILTTVRPDDDEPVTRDAMAFEPDWRCVELLHDRQEYLHRSGVNILCDNGKFRFRGFPLRSMGHLRRLVAALGE